MFGVPVRHARAPHRTDPPCRLPYQLTASPTSDDSVPSGEEFQTSNPPHCISIMSFWHCTISDRNVNTEKHADMMLVCMTVTKEKDTGQC